MKQYLLLLAFLFLVTSFSAQEKKTLKATRTSNPPKIDGILDDAVWKSLPAHSDFRMYQPGNEGDIPEGFETEVINGAQKTLEDPALVALIIELNQNSRYYGYDDQKLHQHVLAHGFQSYRYAPARRELITLGGRRHPTSGNTLYLRDVDALGERVAAAPKRLIRCTGTEL